MTAEIIRVLLNGYELTILIFSSVTSVCDHIFDEAKEERKDLYSIDVKRLCMPSLMKESIVDR